MSAAAQVGQRLANDARWMTLALSLGRRGQGRVWPNPAVGCVIVKNARVIARGWTQDGGRPHAEVHALQAAGAQARGATAYVTLEPCAHTGQTGPCAQALIEAGIARVVVATGDPDPRVAGQGLEMLRAAGIEVTQSVCEAEAMFDHAGFLNRVTQDRPLVTLKLAMSLDGRIALQNGESQWITGPDARRATHAMRATHDAVLVGAGTARADAPSLTVRGLGVRHQPVRVVVSRRLDLPLTGPLYETAKDVPVWLVCGTQAGDAERSAWQDAGARVLDMGDDEVSADAMLRALAQAGITRVFCEGGGALAASLLGAGLVDRLAVFSAGIAIGGDGLPGLGTMGLGKLAEAERFELHAVRRIGADVLQEWRKS